MVTIATLPSAELALISELTSEFGNGYRFSSILPQDILAQLKNSVVVTRIKRIAGAPPDGRYGEDKPVIDVDTFYGDYATADLAARDIQAALLNLRGKQLLIGVVQLTHVIVAPRWLPAPNAALYRFGATYQFHFHTGGRTV